MSRFRYFAIILTGLALTEALRAASLVSQVDARRSGGTSVGSFVNNELPSFLLAPISGSFGIRNNSTAGSWEFAVEADGRARLNSNPTLHLGTIVSFTSANTVIDANGIAYSDDRFNPSEVRYLFARVGTEYHAFEVALWSNNNQNNANGDRLRFYGVRPALLDPQASSVSLVVPESDSLIVLGVGTVSALLIRRRCVCEADAGRSAR